MHACGKRGGFRLLLAYKKGKDTFFLHGFEKNESENISEKEEDAYQTVGSKLLLQRLKNVLPPLVKPVIVTDAGFRAPWFSEMLKMGWDFVGRLRNKNLVRLDNTDDWQLSKSLYQGANAKAKKLGHGILTEKLKIPVNLILYKGKKKNRHKLKPKISFLLHKQRIKPEY